LIAARAQRHASRLPDLKGLAPFVDRIVRGKPAAALVSAR
jgi:hypothetical protein